MYCIQVDQIHCEGEEASLDPFMECFDDLRKTRKLSSAFLSPATDALNELMKTKKMIDKVQNQMVSRGFSPRLRDVTMKPPSIHDFEILKPISKGAYGRVFLAQKKTTKDIYAIKVLKREEMITSRQRDNILLEVSLSLSFSLSHFLSLLTILDSHELQRDILGRINNPFVVKLYYAFRTPRFFYLVMEYLPGGDLHSLLKAFGVFNEESSRVYAAEIVLALEYLHSSMHIG